MANDRVTAADIVRIAHTNPAAASLALGMQLMADSASERSRIVDSVVASKDQRIAELESLVESLYDDAMHWRYLKRALTLPDGGLA